MAAPLNDDEIVLGVYLDLSISKCNSSNEIV